MNSPIKIYGGSHSEENSSFSMNYVTAYTSILKVNLLFLKVRPVHLFNKYLLST